MGPQSDGSVEALVVSGSTVYAGGAFTEIGTETRERLAAICATANAKAKSPRAKSPRGTPIQTAALPR